MGKGNEEHGEGQMREALENMLAHRMKAQGVDRTGWTQEQWIADAQGLMDDLHGSVQSLVNGHVMALLAEVEEQTARAEWAIEKGISWRDRAEKAEAEIGRLRALLKEKP